MGVDAVDRQPAEPADDRLELGEDPLVAGCRARVGLGGVLRHGRSLRARGQSPDRQRPVGRRVGDRVDPVAGPFERIGGQGHAPARLAREGRAVELAPREPEPAKRAQQEVGVGRGFLRVADGGDDVVAGAAPRILAGQRAQHLTRADFEEDAFGVLHQPRNPVREQHGRAQVADPVLGIGRLVLGDPVAGQVGEEGALRLVQGDALNLFAELGQDRLDQGGVGRDLDVHPTGLDALGRQGVGQGLHGVVGAGHDALVVTVDGRDRKVGREPIGQR